MMMTLWETPMIDWREYERWLEDQSTGEPNDRNWNLLRLEAEQQNKTPSTQVKTRTPQLRIYPDKLTGTWFESSGAGWQIRLGNLDPNSSPSYTEKQKIFVDAFNTVKALGIIENTSTFITPWDKKQPAPEYQYAAIGEYWFVLTHQGLVRESRRTEQMDTTGQTYTEIGFDPRKGKLTIDDLNRLIDGHYGIE